MAVWPIWPDDTEKPSPAKNTAMSHTQFERFKKAVAELDAACTTAEAAARAQPTLKNLLSKLWDLYIVPRVGQYNVPPQADKIFIDNYPVKDEPRLKALEVMLHDCRRKLQVAKTEWTRLTPAERQTEPRPELPKVS